MDESVPTDPQPANNSEPWKPQTQEEFLATWLHELRTPMNVIRGYVDLLSDEKAMEEHPIPLEKALAAISFSLGTIERVYDGMAEYYSELKQKP